MARTADRPDSPGRFDTTRSLLARRASSGWCRTVGAMATDVGLAHTALSALAEADYPWRSEHQEAITEYFADSLLRPLEPVERANCGETRLFCLLFSNRSGSTLLADSLYRCGFPIPPQVELFNADLVITTSRDAGIATLTDYLMAIVAGWASNGWLGFKLGPRQFFWLARLGLLSCFREIRVVTCTRNDKLRQAVSLYIARQTGRWHSNMQGRVDAPPPSYCRESLLACLREVLDTEQLIEYACSLHDLPRCAATYEDLTRDANAVVERISAFLGARFAARASAAACMDLPPLQKQGGAENDALLLRLRRELAL